MGTLRKKSKKMKSKNTKSKKCNKNGGGNPYKFKTKTKCRKFKKTSLKSSQRKRHIMNCYCNTNKKSTYFDNRIFNCNSERGVILRNSRDININEDVRVLLSQIRDAIDTLSFDDPLFNDPEKFKRGLSAKYSYLKLSDKVLDYIIGYIKNEIIQKDSFNKADPSRRLRGSWSNSKNNIVRRMQPRTRNNLSSSSSSRRNNSGYLSSTQRYNSRRSGDSNSLTEDPSGIIDTLMSTLYKITDDFQRANEYISSDDLKQLFSKLASTIEKEKQRVDSLTYSPINSSYSNNSGYISNRPFKKINNIERSRDGLQKLQNIVFQYLNDKLNERELALWSQNYYNTLINQNNNELISNEIQKFNESNKQNYLYGLCKNARNNSNINCNINRVIDTSSIKNLGLSISSLDDVERYFSNMPNLSNRQFGTIIALLFENQTIGRDYISYALQSDKKPNPEYPYPETRITVINEGGLREYLNRQLNKKDGVEYILGGKSVAESKRGSIASDSLISQRFSKL